MNVIFMGTPKFSAHILDELSKQHNISLVITQTDKLVGRKKEIVFSPVKELALKKGLELIQPKTLKDSFVHELIKSKNPDYIIVAAYGKILPKAVLDIAPCINTHASLLPKYRGASPIQTAIANGEKTSGVTLMYMDVGLDTGDIIYQEKIDIYNKTSQLVFDEMSCLSANMLLEFLSNPSKFDRIAQDDKLATHTKIIEKNDGLIDLDNAKNIYQKYLAYNEWPNIFLSNKTKLIEIEPFELEKKYEKKGQILKIDKKYFVVSCEIGSLKVVKIQEEGKKIINAYDYINGKRIKEGDFIV